MCSRQFLIEWEHDGLKRNQNDHLEEIVDEIVELIIFPGHHVGCRGTAGHDQNDNKDRNDCTVQHRAEVVLQCKCIRKVLQIKLCRKGKLGLCKILLGFKCVADRHIKGSETDDSDQPQNHNFYCITYFVSCRVNHNSISLFLNCFVMI